MWAPLRRCTGVRRKSLHVSVCTNPQRQNGVVAFIERMPAVGYSLPCGCLPPGRVRFPSFWPSVGWPRAAQCADPASMLTNTRCRGGSATPPFTRSQLVRETKGEAFRLIPRCVITQSSGQQSWLVGALGALRWRYPAWIAVQALADADSWEEGKIGQTRTGAP